MWCGSELAPRASLSPSLSIYLSTHLLPPPPQSFCATRMFFWWLVGSKGRGGGGGSSQQPQQQHQHCLLESCDTTLDKLPVFQEELQDYLSHTHTERHRETHFADLRKSHSFANHGEAKLQFHRKSKSSTASKREMKWLGHQSAEKACEPILRPTNPKITHCKKKFKLSKQATPLNKKRTRKKSNNSSGSPRKNTHTQ